MRVFIALCMIFPLMAGANGMSCDPLLADECNWSSEIKPIGQQAKDQKPESYGAQQGNGSNNESSIAFTVSEFERLIKAIRSEGYKPEQAENSNHIECGNPSLSYADFISCKDLEAQQEMANGTSDMAWAARHSIRWISYPGLALLFGSFVAALFAAKYSRQAANNDLTRNEIELQPVLSIDVLQISVATQHCITVTVDTRPWWGRAIKPMPEEASETTSEDRMMVSLEIENKGKAKAENIMIECRGDNSQLKGRDGTPYKITQERPISTVTAIAGEDGVSAYLSMSVTPSPQKKVSLETAFLSDFVIRYTDDWCEKGTHKVVRCNFNWRITSPEIGVNVVSTTKQKNKKTKRHPIMPRILNR